MRPESWTILFQGFIGQEGLRRHSVTRKRKLRSPEQVVRAIQEGGAMLVSEKQLADVLQKLDISAATWLRW